MINEGVDKLLMIKAITTADIIAYSKMPITKVFFSNTAVF